MRIDEYLGTLPENLLSGEDVILPEKSLRDIFRFVNLGEDDVFYHLGCGNEKGVEIAANEFHVRRAVGIDSNCEKIEAARRNLGAEAELRCENVTDSDISDATVILFWFTDEEIISRMTERFERLSPDTRIVTVWGPLPDCIPDKVRFPYIINRVPLARARDMKEQLRAVFGAECVDFVTAWEFAERYTKAIGSPEVKNDRFLTIIQTLVIWINAKKLGVACGEDIPEPIRTYIKLMKMNFDIDFGPMLEE